MEKQQTRVSILDFFLPPPKLIFGSLFSKTTISLKTASQRYSQSIIMWSTLLKERYKEAMFIPFFCSFVLLEIPSILRQYKIQLMQIPKKKYNNRFYSQVDTVKNSTFSHTHSEVIRTHCKEWYADKTANLKYIKKNNTE